jgi:hypothetical protein
MLLHSLTTTKIVSKLSQIFKEYMLHLVERSPEPFYIKLQTAIPDEPIQIIAPTYTLDHNQGAREIEMRILTPAFYSRFVHYAYTSEAFDRECVFTDEKNRTLWISRPELLHALLQRPSVSEIEPELNARRSYLDELRWNLLRRLRCTPALPAYAITTPSNAKLTLEDVRSLPFSELDGFMRSSREISQVATYRRIVTKLFLAQRFASGFTEIIGLVDLLVRVLLCYLSLFQIVIWRAQVLQAGIDGYSLRVFSNGTLAGCLNDIKQVHGEWWWLIGTACATSSCHVYGLLKGYK